MVMGVRQGRARGRVRVAARAAAAAVVASTVGLAGCSGLSDARIAGNEASAIGALRAIAVAQMTFAASECEGLYAPSLPALAYKNYLSTDLTGASTVEKVGYRVSMTARPGTESPRAGLPPQCQNAVPGFVATAVPLEPGTSGRRFFMTDGSGDVKQASDAAFSDAKPVD